MNYLKIYDEICARAEKVENPTRSVQRDVHLARHPYTCKEPARHRHLIIPSGIWGSHDEPDNIVYLTSKQQIVAYKCLVRIYPYAKHIRITLRKLLSKRGKKSPPPLITHKRKSAAMKKCVRRPHSDETRAKMSVSHKGKSFTDESRMRMSESKRGVKMSESHVAARNHSRKVNGWFTDEARMNMRLAKVGVKKNDNVSVWVIGD